MESLRQLITDKLAGTEAEKRPESLAVSALPIHFEKQRFTDLEIRVKLRSIAPAILPGADPPTPSIQLPPTVPRGSGHRAKSIRRRPRSWTMEPMYMMDSDSDDDYCEAEEPAAKRARRASLPPVHNRRATIKAHSLILASRSEFFEEKLADDPVAGPSSGGTARRVVDVTLDQAPTSTQAGDRFSSPFSAPASLHWAAWRTQGPYFGCRTHCESRGRQG